MRRRLFALAALAPLSLSVTPAVAATERPPADAKPLSQIIKALEDAGFVPIVEVDFKRGFWHVEAFQNGQKRELEVQPVTGEIVSNRRD